MDDRRRRARVATGETETGHWELAIREPHPSLHSYVRHLYGYTEATPGRLRRREFPCPQVVVILEFGPPLRVFECGSTRRWSRYPGGFAAGIHNSFTVTEHDGYQRGIEVALTPVGAALVFGVSMTELSGKVVAVRDLLPAKHRDVTTRLAELPDWDARFDLVERVIAERVVDAHRRTEVVLHAVRWIEERGGATDVHALAGELGYSQKHVIHLFRDHVGVPPKLLARIVRFDRLIQHLRRGGTGTWADLALEFGYYDQSHLVRDVRQFTGTTPTDARTMLAAFGDGSI